MRKPHSWQGLMLSCFRFSFPFILKHSPFCLVAFYKNQCVPQGFINNEHDQIMPWSCDVRDVAQAHVRAAEIVSASGRYIISQATTVPVAQLVQGLEKAFPAYKFPHVEGAEIETITDNSKVGKAISLQAQKSLGTIEHQPHCHIECNLMNLRIGIQFMYAGCERAGPTASWPGRNHRGHGKDHDCTRHCKASHEVGLWINCCKGGISALALPPALPLIGLRCLSTLTLRAVFAC